tara:strand:+ start:15302 stop:16882 length:1581 start_codon:yes stop_codon:yes gene_type:complete
MKFQVFFIGLLLTGCVSKSNQNKRPNILFVISDDQSYPHTSFFGSNFINTPGFDRIAKEGVYFTNCYAGSPGCAPSRSALVTGRHHWQNEQSGQHGSSWMKKHVPFIDEIEANGYLVGRTGKGVDPFQYARNENDSLWRKENAGGPAYNNVSYKENSDDKFASGIANNNYAENFKYFIEKSKDDKPFFFWFGSHEPHRSFEKGSWKKMGKKLEDAEVPEFLPDNEEIRGDLLDYAVEIEWFDSHLQKMLDYLEDIGELDNTIVIVTSDNGMAFPRAKANCYEYGVHVPMAIRYPKEIKGGKINNTPIGFIDIAPTILEVAQTSPDNMMPITGKSIWGLLKSNKEDDNRTVFSGRERHSSSRYQNLGYPQRFVKKGEYLFIWNITPERWPAGAPQKIDAQDTLKLQPLYGLDKNKRYVYQSVFADIDESPSKTNLIENHDTLKEAEYFKLAIEKRPEFELYNVKSDSACLHNLSGIADYNTIENDIKKILMDELMKTNDPRIDSKSFNIFDRYKRYMSIRRFPEPSL